MDTIQTDALIIGMGGAAQLAALNLFDANPDLNIVILSKALRGKGGCSRMVQGGFNVVLQPEDSHEKHLVDTLKGGQFINDQDLATTLVEQATPTVKELETKYGCFFDRNPNGTVHQKPFAGQSFDRTVHKGDLTGIEIISRTTEQVMKRRIPVYEEHRALELLFDPSGREVVGALVLNMRTGKFLVIEAAATLVATGGGPTNYRFHAPGPEKTLDGLAMLYRAGVQMMDMEMVQFHPTGLIVPGSVVAGALLEEGLRGAGAHLFNRDMERYMERYAPDVKERATRDVVSRSSYMEIMADRGFDDGGVHIYAAHLGPDFVRKNFPGMVQRSALFGYDLANGRVPVCPSAHYVMGGAKIDSDCYTSVHRLFVAGEDSTGVHGSNRLGGNGIADSCVFGRQAGKAMAGFLAAERAHPPVSGEHLDRLVARFTEPFDRSHGPSPVDAKDRLRELNWAKVGIVRYGDKLAEARDDIEAIGQEAETVRLTGGRGYNMAYSDWIALLNMLDVSRMTCHSALARLESRGAHYRYDHPDKDDENWLKNVLIRRGDDGRPEVDFQEVDLKYKTPADLPLPAGQ